MQRVRAVRGVCGVERAPSAVRGHELRALSDVPRQPRRVLEVLAAHAQVVAKRQVRTTVSGLNGTVLTSNAK